MVPKPSESIYQQARCLHGWWEVVVVLIFFQPLLLDMSSLHAVVVVVGCLWRLLHLPLLDGATRRPCIYLSMLLVLCPYLRTWWASLSIGCLLPRCVGSCVWCMRGGCLMIRMNTAACAFEPRRRQTKNMKKTFQYYLKCLAQGETAASNV